MAGIDEKYSSSLAGSMDAAEKSVREFLDALFPEEDFGFVSSQFRDATAIRIVSKVRECDALRVN